MTFPLTSVDLARLDTTQRQLLSLTHEDDQSDWMARACTAVRDLVDARHSMFHYIAPDQQIVETTLPVNIQEAYSRDFAHLDNATPRALELGCSVAHMFDVVSADEFHRSALFNEFARPNELYDAMMLRVRVQPDADVWISTQSGQPMSGDDIERARTLLALALPAFSAGARSYINLHRHQSELARMVDALGVPLLICDERGRPLHENNALQDVLRSNPAAGRVREAMTALAMTVAKGEPIGAGRDRLSGKIVGAVANYRLDGTIAAAGAFGPRAVVLVQLQPRRCPGPHRLREMFGLTRREAEVAVLLARRLSNREVAEELSVSIHTAERHTEKVLQKLAASSRNQVRDLLGAP